MYILVGFLLGELFPCCRPCTNTCMHARTHAIHKHMHTHVHIHTHTHTQGMVQGQTYRLRDSGRYLTPEEQGRLREGDCTEDVEISWEKMSKSKYNGVDPEVRVCIVLLEV